MPDPFFSRRPLFMQVAEAMLSQIARGELTDPLPGETTLAGQFGVSRPVLRAALSHLAGKGVVVIAQGKRTRIAPHGEVAVRKRNRLLAISPISRGHTVVLEEVKRQLQRKGWHWMEHYDHDLQTRKAPRLLDGLLLVNRPTVTLLLGSTPAMQRWAEEAAISALVLGTLAEGCSLPSVDVHYRALGWHAGGRFVAAGISEVSLFARRRLRMGDHATLEGMEASIGAGLTVETVEGERELLIRRFRRILKARRGGPIGWFFLFPEDALTAQTFLLAERYQIPGEVALICRDQFPLLDALHPSLAHYETHPAKLVRKAVMLLERLAAGPLQKQEPVRVMPRFVPGQTLTGS